MLLREGLCELSTVARLPTDGAEVPGAKAGCGIVCWAEAATASCRMSGPTALDTCCDARFFISVLLPSLRTVNNQLERLSCCEESTAAYQKGQDLESVVYRSSKRGANIQNVTNCAMGLQAFGLPDSALVLRSRRTAGAVPYWRSTKVEGQARFITFGL